MDQFQAAPQQHGVEMPAEHKQIFAKIYSSAGDIPVDQQHNWCSGTFWPFYTDAVALDRRFEVFEGKPLVVGQRLPDIVKQLASLCEKMQSERIKVVKDNEEYCDKEEQKRKNGDNSDESEGEGFEDDDGEDEEATGDNSDDENAIL